MPNDQMNVQTIAAHTNQGEALPAALAAEQSLLDIDREIDLTLDRMQDELEENGEITHETRQLFDRFFEAFGQKVDRIGRFIRVMENREAYCRSEAARLMERARSAERKVTHTKSLVLYFLESRELTKMEGPQFTLRRQKNSADTLRIKNPSSIPMNFRRVEAIFDGELWEQIAEALPDQLRRSFLSSISCSAPANEAVRQAIIAGTVVDGVTMIRGHHLRVT